MWPLGTPSGPSCISGPIRIRPPLRPVSQRAGGRTGLCVDSGSAAGPTIGRPSARPGGAPSSSNWLSMCCRPPVIIPTDTVLGSLRRWTGRTSTEVRARPHEDPRPARAGWLRGNAQAKCHRQAPEQKERRHRAQRGRTSSRARGPASLARQSHRFATHPPFTRRAGRPPAHGGFAGRPFACHE